MMYVYLRSTGHYQIEGVGYSTIQDVLSWRSDCGLRSWGYFPYTEKLLATSLSLGAGSSGGFSGRPSIWARHSAAPSALWSTRAAA